MRPGTCPSTICPGSQFCLALGTILRTMPGAGLGAAQWALSILSREVSELWRECSTAFGSLFRWQRQH